MRIAISFLLLTAFRCVAQNAAPLPNTQPLDEGGDFSAKMVGGIDRWLTRETERVAGERAQRWRDAVKSENWDAFSADRRTELGRALGVVDARKSGTIEEIVEAGAPAPVADASGVTAHRVRWPVFDGVNGEGVLFVPKGKPRAAIIAIPDADELPEHCRFAHDLAAQGCVVLALVLVDRRDDFSGSAAFARWANQPHREWIQRQAFELGRTIIGYEVQKVFAAIDALDAAKTKLQLPDSPVAVAGYGEGGLIALNAAALDPRIGAALVSGYFGSREKLFAEPVYRNVFSALKNFGDAELAALIAPRSLVVEHSVAPEIAGPPEPDKNRKGAAPGAITTPNLADVESEIARTNELIASIKNAEPVKLIRGKDPQPIRRGSDDALRALLGASAAPVRGVRKSLFPFFGAQRDAGFIRHVNEIAMPEVPKDFIDARQKRTVRELENFTQRLIDECERNRYAAVWTKMKPGDEWNKTQSDLRAQLQNEVIGKIDAERIALNPRSRVVLEKEKWIAHEVVLDVLPDVFAWGWLLVPRDIKPGERRPVVVCQHGLEGLPEDVVNADEKSRAFGYYKNFAAQLADRGYVVFAPHNPYRGLDKFRVLQRKANPLGLSLFSFIIAQHDVATQWLASLPFVDPQRIAFYGLSYGGKTAMRVPACVDRYCLSICSGDFNEWVRKVSQVDYRGGYIFTNEYEMPEWNLANVANYAEMAMLIAPRPFMVERGHDDGVGTDEWVGYEWAKVRRGYDKLGIGERAEIEWFDGPHTIHGVGTFEFLKKHLHWPE